MKVTDLMIGDYLHDEFGNTCVVRYLADVITLENLEGPNAGEMILGTEFEPIPLTPEILKNNGFDGRGAQFICDHTCMIWWKDNIFMFSKYMRHEDLPTENVSINIGYVHELQHALRLCGIDKEITIL